MANIEKLSILIDGEVNGDTNKIDKLTTSLANLQKILSGGFEKTLNSISAFSNAMSKLQNVNITNIDNVVKSLSNPNMFSSLSKLNDLKLTGVNEFGKGLNSLANGLTKLDKIDITNLTSQISKLVTAIAPLTNEMIRGGNSSSIYARAMLALSRASNSVNNENNKTTKSAKSASTSLDKMAKSSTKTSTSTKSASVSLAKLGASLFAIRRIAKFSKQMLDATAEWTENLNLFAVTYGGSAAPAFKDMSKWVVDLSQQFGFSTNQLLKFTGLFKQLSSSLGIADETGTALSKTLTQLSLDFSSFYNVDLEKSFSTMQSAIFGGQTKSMRQLFGIDVTYQSLDQTLQNLSKSYKELDGISSRMLTQNQKALLRTIQVMQGGVNAFGDMSKTANTLQNQMRIFTGSVQNLKLALGDMLMAKPFQFILTYVNALIIAITTLVRAFVPFKKVENELGGVAGGFDEVEESLEETNKTMGLLSFDKFESLSTGDSKQNEDLSATNSLTEELNKLQAEYAEKLKEAEKLFSSIKGSAQNIAEKITKMIVVMDENGGFVAWTDQAKTLATIVGGVLLTSILGIGGGAGMFKNITLAVRECMTSVKGLTTQTTLLGKAFTFIQTHPIILIIGVIVALMVYMYTTNEQFRESINKLMTTLFKLLGSILEPIMDIINILFDMLAPMINDIAMALVPIINLLTNVIQDILPILITLIKVFMLTMIPSIAVFEVLMKIVQTIFLVLKAIFSLKFKGLGNDLKNLWNDWKVDDITKKMIGNLKNSEPQYKAKGGTFDMKGGNALGVVNEYGKDELVYSNQARQIEVSNQSSLEQSFLNALIKYNSLTNSEKLKLEVEFIDKTQSGLVQYITPKIYAEGLRIGIFKK